MFINIRELKKGSDIKIEAPQKNRNISENKVWARWFKSFQFLCQYILNFIRLTLEATSFSTIRNKYNFLIQWHDRYVACMFSIPVTLCH